MALGIAVADDHETEGFCDDVFHVVSFQEMLDCGKLHVFVIAVIDDGFIIG
jgi:hypothetical protein